MLFPTFFEMRLQIGRETGMVEDEPRSGRLRFQLKASDRIDPLGPPLRAPRLHDALVGD